MDDNPSFLSRTCTRNDTLEQLQVALASFPPGLAFPMSELRYDPGAHARDWNAVESSIGLGLPRDYKQLMDGYGYFVPAGIFIVSPNDLATDHDVLGDDLRDWFADSPEKARPVHPEPGGLLLCASTEGRDILCWDTTDPDPDQWPIVWAVEFDEHVFHGGLTRLLVDELNGVLNPRLTAFTVGED